MMVATVPMPPYGSVKSSREVALKEIQPRFADTLREEPCRLLSDAEFALVKPTSVIINTARGPLIDELALIRALQEKRIAGAALDVFEQEPLPADAPHWELPNLTITSHYSGSSPHYHQRALAILLDNLERYKNGEPLRNVVDKKAGY